MLHFVFVSFSLSFFQVNSIPFHSIQFNLSRFVIPQYQPVLFSVSLPTTEFPSPPSVSLITVRNVSSQVSGTYSRISILYSKQRSVSFEIVIECLLYDCRCHYYVKEYRIIIVIIFVIISVIIIIIMNQQQQQLVPQRMNQSIHKQQKKYQNPTSTNISNHINNIKHDPTNDLDDQ